MTPEIVKPRAVDAFDATLQQLLKEYVAGGDQPLLAALKRALPQWIDDLTRDFGNDLYERMMRDPDCDSALDILKLAVLSDGHRVEPAVEPTGQHEQPDAARDARAKRAKELAEFVERRLCDMDISMHDLAYELLDGLALGHKAAEKIAKYVDAGPDAGKLGWRTIKCRNRKNLAFVVDEHSNVLGFLVVEPGGAMTTPIAGVLSDPMKQSGFVPRDKFLLFQHEVRDSDPRGSSVFAAAYNPWFIKTQILPEYYNYLRRFGTPSVVGKTPESADAFTPKIDEKGEKVLDANSNPVLITKEQALLNSLLKWMNGTVIAVPGGSEVDVIQPDGKGEPFLQAFDYLGRQIHQAILGTARATKEAKNNSQADNSAALDILGLVIYFLKIKLGDCFTRDVVKPLIALNFPGEEDIELCPKLCFVASEKADKAALLEAYSKVGFTLHESQFTGIDAEIGLPPRDLEAMERERQHKEDLERIQAGVMGDVYSPMPQPKPEAG